MTDDQREWLTTFRQTHDTLLRVFTGFKDGGVGARRCAVVAADAIHGVHNRPTGFDAKAQVGTK